MNFILLAFTTATCFLGIQGIFNGTITLGKGEYQIFFFKDAAYFASISILIISLITLNIGFKNKLIQNKKAITILQVSAYALAALAIISKNHKII